MATPSWLQRLRSIRYRRQTARSPHKFRPILQQLEDRLCPTAYPYDLLAVTGNSAYSPNGSSAVGTLTNVVQASINASGNVAFLGTQNGFDGVDKSIGPSSNPSVLSFTTRNVTSPQIDDNGDVIAQDQFLSGSTLNTYIRIWQANGDIAVDNGNPYYATGQDVAGSGDILTHPTISADGTQVAYDDSTSFGIFLYINGASAATFPSGSGDIQPRIANNGAVVAQDGSTSTSPIMVYQTGHAPVTIARTSTTMGFTVLGSSPGISADGQVVVFYGDLEGSSALASKLLDGPGIFASINTGSGWQLQRIAGEASPPASYATGVYPTPTGVGPGETFIDSNGDGMIDGNETINLGVAAFDPDAPIAVNSTETTQQQDVTIVYMATGIVNGNQDEGVYANQLDFLPNGAFQDNIDTGVTALPQRGLEGWENWAKQKTASKTC